MGVEGTDPPPPPRRISTTVWSMDESAPASSRSAAGAGAEGMCALSEVTGDGYGTTNSAPEGKRVMPVRRRNMSRRRRHSSAVVARPMRRRRSSRSSAVGVGFACAVVVGIGAGALGEIFAEGATTSTGDSVAEGTTRRDAGAFAPLGLELDGPLLG
jgi:hypothetical protein